MSHIMIKKITLVVILSFFAFSCSSEGVDLGVEQQLNVPGWAKGNFAGVHTQEPLHVSEGLISFEFSNELHTYDKSDVLEEITEGGRYVLLINDGTQLIFNKSSRPDEINLMYNDLNLGWFIFVSE
jgi:hypothetical protein